METHFETVDVGPECISTPAQGTPADIIEIAKTIFKFVRDKRDSCGPTEEGRQKLFELAQKEFPDFCHTFFIAVRWMVEFDRFHPRALEKYLTKYQAQLRMNFKTEDDMLEAQVYYLISLYKEQNPRWDKHKVNQYRQELTIALKSETSKFNQAKKEVEEEIEQRKQSVTAQQRTDLYQFLLQQKLDGSGGSLPSAEQLLVADQPLPGP
jgi:hypothetical protein